MRRSSPAPSSGPRFPYSGVFRLLLGWALCQCSLSLEDPAQEAKDKLAKVVPTTLELMTGRWIADSTYTADDTRATRLIGDSVRLDILPDTSYAQLDTARSAFPNARAEGIFYLHVDTLILFPLAAAPDTFIVHMRFLGNYLELQRASEQRFTFFHKRKAPAGLAEDSLLADSLWELRGHRDAPGVYRREELARDFDYLRFRGDSLFTDRRRNGLVRTDSGPLERDGRHWIWKASGGTREFLADLLSADSLRVWPLASGRPDSGCYDYVRAFAHHPFDVDMRPLLGHLRGDSLKSGSNALDYHYGRYYDWILGEDHAARVETNMAGVPVWTAWTLDSGYLSLAYPGHAAQRLRVDTAGGRLRLIMDTSGYFPSRSAYSATLVSGDFAARPLDRFDKASYLELKAGPDSLFYFFGESNRKDRFEILAGPDAGAMWAGFVLPKSSETFQSGQDGFYLAFQDSTRALGRFACRSSASLNLAIRQADTDPEFASGFIQGACQIQRADSAFSDSALAIEGAFKLRRIDRGGFGNPGWSLP